MNIILTGVTITAFIYLFGMGLNYYLLEGTSKETPHEKAVYWFSVTASWGIWLIVLWDWIKRR